MTETNKGKTDKNERNQAETSSIEANRNRVKETVILGMMAAMMEVGKLALAIIPNIEVVSLMLIVFTIFYGKKIFIVTFVYALIECLVWGMGTWVIMYLYVWPILVLAVIIIKKIDPEADKMKYSILSATFGLTFGFFCSFTYVVAGGIEAGIGWWFSGIPFDLIHCAGNFFICFFLFEPLMRVMKKLV